jgi:hypothetical protein
MGMFGDLRADRFSFDDSGIASWASWGIWPGEDFGEGVSYRCVEALRGENPPGG